MNVKQIESMFDKQPGRGFLDPIAMSQLQRAYKGRKKTVVLSGIEYAITYGFKRHYPVSGENAEAIRLNRTDGKFIPMAYVAVKRILSFKFDEDEK